MAQAISAQIRCEPCVSPRTKGRHQGAVCFFEAVFSIAPHFISAHMAAELPVEQPAWVTSLVSGVVEKVQAENHKLVEDLKLKVDKHNEAITNHEERLVRLEMVKSWAPSSRTADFVPRIVEVRGFCDFKDV